MGLNVEEEVAQLVTTSILIISLPTLVEVGWEWFDVLSARALSVSRCCDRSQRSSDWALLTPRGKWWYVPLAVPLAPPGLGSCGTRTRPTRDD
jgi:hypothetical protein